MTLFEIREQAEKVRRAFAAGAEDHRDTYAYRLIRDLTEIVIDQVERIDTLEASLERAEAAAIRRASA